MLGMPATTDYDLKFRVLDIPVRVHPFFWVASAVLGWDGRSGLEVMVWIACVFVSILVHEFGHGLTARALARQQPSVVLYLMGGLCFYEREQRSPWRRLAVILMGPGAGFLLFGLVTLAGVSLLGIDPFGIFVHQPPRWTRPIMWEVYNDLLYINLFWGVFNLFPIYPLDGGQAAQTLLKVYDRNQGERWSYILGLATAGLLALYLYQNGQTANAVSVAYLGFINFQAFQVIRYQGRYDSGGYSDDNRWQG